MEDYIVSVREVHIQNVKISADDEKDALEKVWQGEGEYIEPTEYSHTLDSTLWTVEKVK